MTPSSRAGASSVDALVLSPGSNISTSWHMGTRLYAHMHPHTHMHSHAFTHMHKLTYTHALTCTHTHAQTRIHTCTHTHTLTLSHLPRCVLGAVHLPSLVLSEWEALLPSQKIRWGGVSGEGTHRACVPWERSVHWKRVPNAVASSAASATNPGPAGLKVKDTPGQSPPPASVCCCCY